jgi:hypothetical protein
MPVHRSSLLDSLDENPTFVLKVLVVRIILLEFPRSLFEGIAFWTGGMLRNLLLDFVCSSCLRRASRICLCLLLLRICVHEARFGEDDRLGVLGIIRIPHPRCRGCRSTLRPGTWKRFTLRAGGGGRLAFSRWPEPLQDALVASLDTVRGGVRLLVGVCTIPALAHRLPESAFAPMLSRWTAEVLH